MAGGLPEPILISELVHLDHITIAGQTVEFRHVFYTWMAMLILFVVGWLVRRNISLIPGKMQNIFESIIGGLEDFTVTNMGEDGRKVFPVLGGLFLFIAVQNILGLIPACDAPTANINTNIGMALFVFLYYNYQGIKRWHGHYIHHFMGPMLPLAPFMMILEFISHLKRYTTNLCTSSSQCLALGFVQNSMYPSRVHTGFTFFGAFGAFESINGMRG